MSRRSGFAAIARDTSATPGVYASASSRRPSVAIRDVTASLPPACRANTGWAGSGRGGGDGVMGAGVVVAGTVSVDTGTPLTTDRSHPSAPGRTVRPRHGGIDVGYGRRL